MSKASKGGLYDPKRVLVQSTRLCIPKCATRDLVIREIYGGSLAGHYAENKTLTMLWEHYFWPGMSKDVHVQDSLGTCATCQVAKHHSLPHLSLIHI